MVQDDGMAWESKTAKRIVPFFQGKGLDRNALGD